MYSSIVLTKYHFFVLLIMLLTTLISSSLAHANQIADCIANALVRLSNQEKSNLATTKNSKSTGLEITVQENHMLEQLLNPKIDFKSKNTIAQELVRSNKPQVLLKLKTMLRTNPDLDVGYSILNALDLEHKLTLEDIYYALKKKPAIHELKQTCLQILRKFKNPVGSDAAQASGPLNTLEAKIFKDLLNDREPTIRAAATNAIPDSPAGINQLIKKLTDFNEDPEVKYTAAERLFNISRDNKSKEEIIIAVFKKVLTNRKTDRILLEDILHYLTAMSDPRGKEIAEKYNQSVAREKELYQPIKTPKKIPTEEVINADAVVCKELDKLGVKYTPVDGEKTALQKNAIMEKTELVGDLHQTTSFGQILRIDSLPEPMPKGSALTNAFLHPDMKSYKAELDKMGISLVVDTSVGFTGSGGYYTPGEMIAVTPNMSWHEFLHEFQHVQFDRYIRNDFNNYVYEVREGKDLLSVLPVEVVSKLGSKLIKQLEILIKKGIPENGVDETLAVDEQLKTLGFRRYTVLGRYYKKYALRHQISSINKDLPFQQDDAISKQQRKTVLQAKIKHGLLTQADYLPLGLPIVTMAGYLFWWNVKKDKNTNHRQLLNKIQNVYYDDQGNLIGVLPDGTLVYVKLANK